MFDDRETRVSSRAVRLIAVLFLALLAGSLVVIARGGFAENALAGQTPLQTGAIAPSEASNEASRETTRTPGANVKGKASCLALFQYGWSGGEQCSATTKTTSSYDVTGDGLADALCFSAIPLDGAPGLAERIEVQLDSTVVYVLEAGSTGIDQATFSLITLKDGTPFLFASAYSPDGLAHQYAMKYRGGVFEPAFDNTLLAKQGVSDAHISSIKAAGNRIIVQYEFVSTVTGVSRTSFTYIYSGFDSGSALKLANDTTLALRYATTARGAFTKQPCKAASSFNVYASASLTGSFFTVKKGESVQPLGVKLSGGELLYKLGYGKKTGWVKCPQASSVEGGILLTGVYGSVSLENEALPYSADTKADVARLQKLSNYALFLMRNEIYARQGMTFASDELSAYFSKQDWYVPTASSVVLSKTDASYAALLLDIERNRKSPYVS